MEDQARIVIVGGGIMGAGLLYHLAEQGCTDALLIEKAELTSGSTWHAAGQCPHLVGNYNLAKIHDTSISLYKRLEEITGQFVSWHTSGSIRFALTQRDLMVSNRARHCRKRGFPMEIIDVGKIRELHPFVNLDGVLAGAWTPDDGHADPAGLCNAMAGGARANGCANRSPQPGHGHQPPPIRGVGGGHGAGAGDCRTGGQRRRGATPGRWRRWSGRCADLQHPASLLGFRAGCGVCRTRCGSARHSRPLRLRLSAPGAAIRPDRHL